MSWIEDPGISVFGEFNLTELDTDEAWLNVTSAAKETLWLYELSSNCYECPFQRSSMSILKENKSIIQKIKTAFSLTYRLRYSGQDEIVAVKNDSKVFCELSHSFGEFGVYDMIAIKENGIPSCEIVTRLQPVNIYLPILVAVAFYFFLAIVFTITSRYKDKLKSCFARVLGHFQRGTNIEVQSDSLASSSAPMISTNEEDDISMSSSSPSTSTTLHKRKTPRNRKSASRSHTSSPVLTEAEKKRLDSQHDVNKGMEVMEPLTGSSEVRRGIEIDKTKVQVISQRLRFVDTFRGVCIVMMIFVNDGGADYYFLEHASWDGLYVADVIFPWFLMCMGISLPLNLVAQLKRGNSKPKIFRGILSRTLKLLLIIIFLNTAKKAAPTNLGVLRLPGVLQRFGICYFVTASIFILFIDEEIARVRDTTQEESIESESNFRDIKVLIVPWMITLLLLIFHCVITFSLPVPGCPTGYLGPGGLHKENAYPKDCVGGAAGYIDRQLFSVNHIYKFPTSKSVYKCGVFDPEGTLGILTSISQVWFGVQAGVTLLMFPKASSRLKRYFVMALITGIIGMVLCEAKQTGGLIPVNKNLWSLSYVLVTTSLGVALFCLLYIITDIKSWWSGSPFFECGMNSITLYIGHTIANSMLPWHYVYGNMSTHFSKLVETLWGVSLWIMIAIYLHKKKTFLSL